MGGGIGGGYHIFMHQDYIHKSIRAASVVTSGYVAATVIEDAHLLNQLVLLAQWTKVAATSLFLKVEYSNDKVTWYQESFSSVSGGVDTITLGYHVLDATGNYAIPIATKYKFIRISAQGNGNLTNTVLALEAIVGVS